MLSCKIILCCILATIGLIECGDYLEVEGRNYYISYPQALSWYMAYRFCAYQDMYLVDIGDQAENNRVMKIINHVNTKYSVRNTDWWTSGTDLASHGTYYWAVNGKDMSYHNWIPGQPDSWEEYPNAEIEHCMYLSHTHSYQWNDMPCSSKKYFVCRETINESSGQPTKCTQA